jgi:hypothetical protein
VGSCLLRLLMGILDSLLIGNREASRAVAGKSILQQSIRGVERVVNELLRHLFPAVKNASANVGDCAKNGVLLPKFIGDKAGKAAAGACWGRWRCSSSNLIYLVIGRVIRHRNGASVGFDCAGHFICPPGLICPLLDRAHIPQRLQPLSGQREPSHSPAASSPSALGSWSPPRSLE